MIDMPACRIEQEYDPKFKVIKETHKMKAGMPSLILLLIIYLVILVKADSKSLLLLD
jgi:hypothetical protein